MSVDIELLQKITHGAVKITEESDGFHFYRMTEAQSETARNSAEAFYLKSLSAAGERFEFTTDARSVEISGILSFGGSRNYAYFDVKVNGVLVQHQGSDNYIENPEFSLSIPLDGQKNNISVYMPAHAQVILQNIEFKNATVIETVKKDLTMICWGDSITQGYDAVFPSFSYTNLLADALNAEIFNKGIGGEIFNSAYFDEKESVEPDLITVAYGTNDWVKLSSADELRTNADSFFAKLTASYPEAEIYAIIPIWRADNDKVNPTGTFDDIRNILFAICSKYNVKTIDGMRIIPHNESFFWDERLHPNETGFLCMAQKILEHIKRS